MANQNGGRICPKCGTKLGQKNICPICGGPERNTNTGNEHSSPNQPGQKRGGRVCPKCGMKLGQKNICPICGKSQEKPKQKTAGNGQTQSLFSFDPASETKDADVIRRIKRISILIRQEEWDEARRYCNDALDLEPENAILCFQMALIDCKVSAADNLWKVSPPLSENKSFRIAMDLASPEFKEKMLQIKQIIPAEGMIPDGITEIEKDTFKNCTSLTSVTIPNSVKSIGDSAFSGCTGLKSVVIPDGVRTIGNHAFEGCTGLTSVVIPDSVKEIGYNAFKGCTRLSIITIPYCVLEKTVRKVFGKRIPSIIISNSVTEIPYEAFSDCYGLSSITIPNSVSIIGDSAFEKCTGLTNVMIPDSVTTIEYGAFSECSSLTSVTIPDSVKTIGKYAFFNTRLASLTIPKSVIMIDEFAFDGWKSSFDSVTVLNSMAQIGYGAFGTCRNIKKGNAVPSVSDSGHTTVNSPANFISTYGQFQFE